MATPYSPDWLWQLLSSAGVVLMDLTVATSRSVSWPLDGAATAQFTMPALDPETAQVVELATDVLVNRAGQALFRGRITASTETHLGDTHTLSVTATDYRGMLDHRLIWPGVVVDFPNLDVAEIAWTLIQSMQVLEGGPDGTEAGVYDLGITQGTGYPSYSATYQFSYGSTISSAINTMANTNSGGPSAIGFDWSVDQNLEFNIWWPQRGAYHGVDLAYGDDKLAGVTLTVAPDSYANGIYMTGGKAAGSGQMYSIKRALVPSGYGAWDQQKSDSNQTLQQALDDEAGGWLTELARVQYQTVVATLVAGTWDPGLVPHSGGTWVGDTVHLSVDVGRLSASNLAMRVDQIDVTIDDDGVELVSMNLGISPPKLTRRFASINKRISKLELEPKGHVLASASDVTGPGGTWFVVTGFTPRALNWRYRAQAHMTVPTLPPVLFSDVNLRVRYTDPAGTAQIMTMFPPQLIKAGTWFPPSVQFDALGSLTDPGYPITIEALTDNPAVTFSGQIESV